MIVSSYTRLVGWVRI